MASGKTENYGLSQWEATDQVVRGDFNADNAKIDAGMAENKAAAAAAKETAENLAAVAFTQENLPFVVGTYTGNSAASRTISLGFTPRAVLVVPANGEMCRYSSGSYQYYGGFAISGHNAADSAGNIINVVENGFQVHYSDGPYSDILSNTSNETYHYLALK